MSATQTLAFSPTPSLEPSARAAVATAGAVPESATAVGVPVAATGTVPAELGLERAELETAGFDGSVGSTLVLPAADGPVLVAVGVGDPDRLDAHALRDAAAAFARAVKSHVVLTTTLADIEAVEPKIAGQAVVEGVLLARYGFDALRR